MTGDIILCLRILSLLIPISLYRTSAFGTCIQKYVIERYVCLIVFMVIAQAHVQAVATVHYSYAYYVDIGPLRRYYVDMCPLSRYSVDMCPFSRYYVDMCPFIISTVWTYVCTVTTVRTDFAGS